MRQIGCALVLSLGLVGCSSSQPSAASRSTTSGSYVTITRCLTGVSGGAAERPSEILGTLEMVGGPAPGLPRPVRGTVTATASSGNRCDVKVGDDGRFDLDLAPGVYRLTGRSPRFGGGRYPCAADGKVALAGPLIVANVICSVR